MHRFLGIGTISFFIFCFSCQDQTNQAETATEAIQVVDSTQQFISYAIDSTESVVTWISSATDRKLDGILPFKNGELVLSESGRLTGIFTLDVTQLQISDFTLPKKRSDSLHKQMFSKEWLDISQYPTALFTLTTITPFDTAWIPPFITEGDGPNQPETYADFMIEEPTHLISGNLTLKEITHKIALPVMLKQDSVSIQMEGRFNIDGSRWNLMPVQEDKRSKYYKTLNIGFYLIANNVSKD